MVGFFTLADVPVLVTMFTDKEEEEEEHQLVEIQLAVEVGGKPASILAGVWVARTGSACHCVSVLSVRSGGVGSWGKTGTRVSEGLGAPV